MKTWRVVLPLAVLVWVGFQVTDRVRGGSGDPTFHGDVATILQARCQACHRPGEAGPMPLLELEDARTWAPRIREVVSTERMPPWFSDDAHGTFSNDARLTAEEQRTILAWIDAGMPAGDARFSPAPAVFTAGWAIGKPDAVVALPRPFTVPARGVIEYQTVLLPTGFTEDTWVRSIEIRPTDRAVVHHVQVYLRPPGPNGPRHDEHGHFHELLPGQLPVADDGVGSIQAAGTEQVCVYVPGGSPCVLGDGQARLIPAGSDLFLIVHYQSVGREVEDRTQIGFRFADGPPRERVRNFFLANHAFRIPPGAAEHQVTAQVTLARPATLVSLMPHMHFRGTAFQFRLTYPDGRNEVVLNVPRYDPNWQLTYVLAQPRQLPAGTTITAIGTFDNSSGNPLNPDPSVEVRWGHQAWEEMHTGFFDLAVPAGEDHQKLFVPRT